MQPNHILLLQPDIDLHIELADIYKHTEEFNEKDAQK